LKSISNALPLPDSMKQFEWPSNSSFSGSPLMWRMTLSASVSDFKVRHRARFRCGDVRRIADHKDIRVLERLQRVFVRRDEVEVVTEGTGGAQLRRPCSSAWSPAGRRALRDRRSAEFVVFLVHTLRHEVGHELDALCP